MWAYVIAGVLGIVAIYFFIRMIEWDRMNESTPGQDDPFLDDREDQ